MSKRGRDINGKFIEDVRLRLSPQVKARLDSLAYPKPLAGWLRDKLTVMARRGIAREGRRG